MDQAAKQQIVERVKQAENILVTVSVNPSVDQLASAIGLTLLLNKMGKGGTAVFSGKIPSTIEFLQPEKTLETNTDSLRDFIISLDKAKADKLRYKIDDNVVRIFITPYKTKLSEKDLQYSEGDFNVEVIIALGVTDRGHLDGAITAHGRILHDATVIALSAGEGKAPDLGQINWQDPFASSLAEMLVSLSEAFGQNLIDNQSATAFLTGIVAETERFSNKKTSPKVMTMSAQLMAAGANQQLVISKLQPPPPPPPPPAAPPPKPKPQPEPPKPKAAPPPPPPKPKAPVPPPKPPEPEKKKDGELNVGHDGQKSDGDEVEINTSEIHIDSKGNLLTVEEGTKKPDAAKEEPLKKEKAEDKKEDARPVEPAPLPSAPEPPVATIAPPPLPPPPPPIPKQEPVIPPPPPPPPPAPAADTQPLPSPKLDDLGDLPPLPAPEPLPPIRLDEHMQPHISSQAAAPSPLPSPPPAAMQPPIPDSPHAVLDPLRQPPRMSSSFSADTSNGGGPGSEPSMLVDPVNNVPLNPQGGESYSQARQMAPPPPSQNPIDQMLANASAATPAPAPGDLTEESARQAVENAFSGAPFDPAGHPQQNVGAMPMGPELHQPPAEVVAQPPTQPPAYDNATPSLNLPMPPPGPPPVAPPPPNNMPPPAVPPPPGPPPFMPPPSL